MLSYGILLQLETYTILAKKLHMPWEQHKFLLQNNYKYINYNK